MKILFVTLYALETNTSVTKSNYGILAGIKKLGYEITVVTPSLDESVSYYDDSLMVDGIKICRIKSGGFGQRAASVGSSKGVLISALLKYARILYKYTNVFDRTKELVNRVDDLDIYNDYYDYIISTSDPKTSHIFAQNIIKKGLKYGMWIQHWGDPLAGDISRKSIYPESYFRKIEYNIIKNADKVVYVSPFTLEDQKNNYPAIAEKLKFVPLTCDTPQNTTQSQSLHKGKLQIAYVGDYSSHIRNIIPLYEACKNCSDVQLTIAGGTDIVLDETENIKIYPRVPQSKAHEIEEKADVIVSVGNLKGSQIPGKIYYLASSSTSILVTVDGSNKEALMDYIKSYNRYEVCLNTTKDIIASINMLKDKESKCPITPSALLPENVVKSILE